MIDNPVIDAMLMRKSIRHYTDKTPADEVIAAVVRAGQQAHFQKDGAMVDHSR